MKIATGQTMPNFSIADVGGKPIDLQQFRGRKVHLIFYRFAGCPFCNLHFHSIEKLKELYKKNDVVLISVYESSAENLKDMIADQSFYSIMVPDSQSKLYTQFSLERSLLGLFKYMLLGGGLADAMKGMQLFKKKVKLDGHTDRKEAEFLIDANGQVALAHYASAPGDLLPIATVQQFITA